jgi:hypothetical protein
MTWLCDIQGPLHAQAAALSFPFWAGLALAGLVYALGVLPRVYRYRRNVFGSRATYDLGNISNAELRDAGLGWAVWLRRGAIIATLAFLARLVLLPAYCAPV